MRVPIFLFDLDSTLTKKEILAEISREIDCYDEMSRLTESTMRGELSFEESFLKRVKMLSDIPVSTVKRIVSDIPINEEINSFIQKYRERCYIITGNLDVWISDLMQKIGMQDRCICSKAVIKDDKIVDVLYVVDKGKQAEQFRHPFIAIGDGSNDVAMAKSADYSIGFGGVREVSPVLAGCVDYIAPSDHECAEKLRMLLMKTGETNENIDFWGF